MRPRSSSSLKCLLLLVWNAVSLAAVCLQPDVPENGHIFFETTSRYRPGIQAKYACTPGFECVGVERRVCHENGTWSGRAPICAIKVALNKLAQLSSGEGAQNALDESARCALNEPEA
ncbi:Sushi, von Willebrand factor type A, EGF and pentraxin domain-containing protein 1 [Toxocara canis]|uniref:Sushi, von Willebrand factor type A, EGF and pentraxin domain-containing protein 1 n=1 Tax=Toxocara canis TaxID=6265 RepID=A0A0B2UP31_TOXCA|nr:Sushi, von Willebrand factor type A, EGF and pentraxin domain-containing protein 1 [Toxocara canis]